METGFTPQLIGQAEKDFGSSAPTKEMGKDQFLHLLLAQLEYQDPLNPMDDKEFVAQLAQFTSLEELKNINTSLDGLNEGAERQEMLSAVSFIGKQVRAEGDSISKDADGNITRAYFSFDQPAANVFANIFDENGNIVRTENLGSMQGGFYEYTWDGLDYKGAEMPQGVYDVYLAAEGPEGQPVMVDLQVSGTVAGVQNEGGRQYLRLDDGRVVDLLKVKEVVGGETATP
jgi:flagellar basal-body rod modification protein FlgD